MDSNNLNPFQGKFNTLESLFSAFMKKMDRYENKGKGEGGFNQFQGQFNTQGMTGGPKVKVGASRRRLNRSIRHPKNDTTILVCNHVIQKNIKCTFI